MKMNLDAIDDCRAHSLFPIVTIDLNMSKKQCNCINSKISPHRREKCFLLGKKSKSKQPKPSNEPETISQSEVITAEVVEAIPPNVFMENFQQAALIDEENVSQGEFIDELMVEKLKIFDDGNDECDCSAYIISPHRKNKCTLKKMMGNKFDRSVPPELRCSEHGVQNATPILEPYTEVSTSQPVLLTSSKPI